MAKTLVRSGGSPVPSSRRRLYGAALVLALSLTALGVTRSAGARRAESSPTSTQAEYVRASTIGEVLSRWRPETHLYVLGDVGLEGDALQELAAWLGDKHWTILLVQDASGQTYTDVERRMHSGEDAIEYGTGQGIPKQRGFSAQVHPRSHEPDGAIFTIVLAQRVLFYTGSQAQDSRSLGEAQFQDNLDQWAIQAMRSGGDILTAVKETVTQIDARVDSAITQELQDAELSIENAMAQLDALASRSRELRETVPGGFRNLQITDAAALRPQVERARAAREQGRAREALQILGSVLIEASSAIQALDSLQRSFDTGRSALQSAATSLATLEERAAGLRKTYPKLNGPLVRPDVEKLRQELAAAEATLRDDPDQASRTAEAVRSQILPQILAIVEYPVIGEALGAAQARLAALERRERATAARRELLESRQGLAEARDLFARGAPGYAERLKHAENALWMAERRISAADADAAFRRAVILLLFLLLAVALASAGFSLNRRRRGIKREAEQLLVGWRSALDRKLEILLDELEQRVARFVGPASGEGMRPWTDETLRLSEQIRADVGSLYILWTSASSVLQQAESLIRARGLGAVYNFFLPAKYRRGIALLKDEPVPFDPADGLPKLFGYERTWRDDLLGDLSSYEPFRKSFQEIVAELNLRAARATEALDLVESSVVQGPSALEETGERIRQTEGRRDEIERAGSAEGLFLASAIFAAALPAASAALDRARTLLPTDPVGALRHDGASARRIATEASQLAGLVAAARRGVLPAIAAGIGALREAAIATGWIESERIQLSERVDLLAEQAAREPASTGIEELALELADLGLRVERAVALSGVLRETARLEILRIADLVRSAREELGSALRLPPDRLLREEDADPSERWESSIQQADAAQAALGQGGLDAAEAALAEAAWLTAEAEAIVEATQQSFATHAATVEERRAETGRIEGLVPDHERILAEIRETFAPSVLALRSGDPDHPDANGTLADNLEETRTHIGLAHAKLDRAVTVFPEGKLLAAAALLREVKEHQELAVHRLEEIAERRARLEKTLVSNRDLLGILENRVREDQVGIAGDPRIMQPTLAAFEQGMGQVEQARRRVEETPGDPFLAEEDLLAAKATLDHVHDRMAPGDRTLYIEAQKSVEAANRQLAATDALSRRAAGDGIPDSPETVLSLRNLESLYAAQAQAQDALGLHHGDWKALDVEADRIAAEAARCAGTLTGELAAAEKASNEISNAARTVRGAGSWSSAYGVIISGNPGSNALSRARSLLEQGRYDEAAQEAGRARQEAAQAITEAEATVRRLRAEDEEREEERRRQSWSSSSSSSSRSSSRSSSSGSGRSSWGSSSSGSGRSSWGGSSSGSGKSRW